MRSSSSTPRTVVGPEGTVALVTGAAVAPLAGGDPAKWVLLVSMLAIMTGVVFLIARLAKIGWMADYLSQAVLVGYIAGVAIVLIIGRIGKLTGIPSADGNALRELWGTPRTCTAANPRPWRSGSARWSSSWSCAGRCRPGPRRSSSSCWASPWPRGWTWSAEGSRSSARSPPACRLRDPGRRPRRCAVTDRTGVGIFLVSFSDAILTPGDRREEP